MANPVSWLSLCSSRSRPTSRPTACSTPLRPSYLSGAPRPAPAPAPPPERADQEERAAAPPEREPEALRTAPPSAEASGGVPDRADVQTGEPSDVAKTHSGAGSPESPPTLDPSVPPAERAT